MSDLWDLGVRGYVLLFIKGFLFHRSFRVKVGCSLSEHFELQIRAPRGSILSPALFNATINNNAQTILQELTLCNSLTILSYVSEARVERAMQLRCSVSRCGGVDRRVCVVTVSQKKNISQV